MYQKHNGATVITLEDLSEELGSLLKFLHDVYNCEIYLKEVPEGFEVPSLFIRPPHEIDSDDTLSTYKVNYLIPIKVFNVDNVKSYNHASKIAQAIRSNRYRIPYVDINGVKTGKYFRINNRIDINQVDNGVNEIILSWNIRYYFIGRYNGVIGSDTEDKYEGSNNGHEGFEPDNSTGSGSNNGGVDGGGSNSGGTGEGGGSTDPSLPTDPTVPVKPSDPHSLRKKIKSLILDFTIKK